MSRNLTATLGRPHGRAAPIPWEPDRELPFSTGRRWPRAASGVLPAASFTSGTQGPPDTISRLDTLRRCCVVGIVDSTCVLLGPFFFPSVHPCPTVLGREVSLSWSSSIVKRGGYSVNVPDFHRPSGTPGPGEIGLIPRVQCKHGLPGEIMTGEWHCMTHCNSPTGMDNVRWD